MADTLPPCCSPSLEYSLPEIAYCAYCTSRGGLNYQGLPCPVWSDLPEGIREAWVAVVAAVDAGVVRPGKPTR